MQSSVIQWVENLLYRRTKEHLSLAGSLLWLMYLCLVSFLLWLLAVGFWLCITSCWNLRLSESRAKLAWAMPSVSKLNNAKQVQDDVGWCWLLAPCIVMLNLVQHLTASLSCSCPRTDPETSSGWRLGMLWAFSCPSPLTDPELNSGWHDA